MDFMKNLIPIALASFLAAAGCTDKGNQDSGVRKLFDDVGFCSTKDQIEKVIQVSEDLEEEKAGETAQTGGGTVSVGALCPHDDHLYAGRVYIHVLPQIAKAGTIVIFGVTHKKARELLGNPRGIVILDDFDAWQAPGGPVPVDKKLREAIRSNLDRKLWITSREGHASEHSIEAMLPFLQHYNPGVRIVPVMVTQTTFEQADRVSDELSGIIERYAREKGLKLGQDLTMLISSDSVHYGPDFEYSPFGLDEAAHEKGMKQDMEIGRNFLSGALNRDKIRKFTDKVWGQGIPWCGRFSIPVGLLTLLKTARALAGKPVAGLPKKYSDSYSLGVLPIVKQGIGTTAPFSQKHWVGYWGISYEIPAK
jgi:AmmeMemoRadiSam system protein B